MAEPMVLRRLSLQAAFTLGILALLAVAVFAPV